MTRTGQRRRAPSQELAGAVVDDHHAAPLDERKVRAIVREELRALFGPLLNEERVYSSRRGHGPEGYSDEAWKDLARRIGTRRGRWYIVTVEQLAAHEAGDRDPKPANDSPAPAAWHPSMAARALGLRPAGGSR